MKIASTSVHPRLTLPRRLMLVGLALAALTANVWAAPAKNAGKNAAMKTAKAVAPAAKAETPEVAKEEAAVEPASAQVSLPPAGSSPMQELKKSNAALKKLFQKQSPSWSPEHDAKRSEMRKIVNGFLDFEELAHRALARHWEGLSQKQRSEFVTVLRELIERNYIRQVHGQPSYDLRFEKESITGSEGSVEATLDSTSDGKKVRITMEYKLLYKGTRWLVYDVVTDEQSMLENYRAEFNRIITKESFDALLKRMKKRLEKTD